jgi:polyhydroxybutyrate depolymerase
VQSPSRLFWSLLALLALVAACVHASAARSHQARSVEQELSVDGLTRTFRLHVPADLPAGEAVPLVMVFHGGGGTAWGTERLTGFSGMADRGHFIVVYPEGIERSWNDGRDTTVSRAHRDNIDDVHFVAVMIDAISKEHRIDPKRIYATGISNGAIFSHYLAANLADRIAAIAPVVGGIADPFAARFDPAQPVSVLMFQGTDDPLVPFDGGDVAWGNRGKIISTAETVKKWMQRDGCAPIARTGMVPDNDPADGCRAEWSTWSSCRDGTEVTLYTLHGAGHTWPGGGQYLPRFLIGKVCRDIDATEVIWNFFRRHAKP